MGKGKSKAEWQAQLERRRGVVEGRYICYFLEGNQNLNMATVWNDVAEDKYLQRPTTPGFSKGSMAASWGVPRNTKSVRAYGPCTTLPEGMDTECDYQVQGHGLEVEVEVVQQC